MVKKAIMCALIFIVIFEFAMPGHVVASSFSQDDFNQIDQEGSVTRN